VYRFSGFIFGGVLISNSILVRPLQCPFQVIIHQPNNFTQLGTDSVVKQTTKRNAVLCGKILGHPISCAPFSCYRSPVLLQGLTLIRSLPSPVARQPDQPYSPILITTVHPPLRACGLKLLFLSTPTTNSSAIYRLKPPQSS
jgi:hypothetical protein